MQYTVIQFVPDQMANERINVGVILIDETKTLHYSFLTNWERVYAFVKNPVIVYAILKPTLDQIQKIGTLEELNKDMDFYNNSAYSILNFTPFRGSLDPDAPGTLAYLTKSFLK